MIFTPQLFSKSLKRSQTGLAMLVVLLIVALSAMAGLLGILNSEQLQNEQNQKTTDSLALAKAALIASTVTVDLSGSARPGDMPCPDLNNDGIAELSCSNATGMALGRLPWRTLGLEDLRDGHGERLWYAVSSNLKNNPRTACNVPGQNGCLNSDSIGTITVRRPNGAIVLNGEGNTGAVAVVFSPGPPIVRQGMVEVQNRSCELGVNCDSSNICTTNPANLTPTCNASNYLDIASGEDNAVFEDATLNGFIQGPILDNLGNVILNDQVLTIQFSEVLPLMEKRVLREVEKCLEEYPTASPTGNTRYPYAAAVIPGLSMPNYSDASAPTFGRIPDTPFTRTQLEGNYSFTFLGIPFSINTMSDEWSAACKIKSNSGWWLNWKEQVFYAVSDAFKPAPNYIGSFPTPNPATCPTCIVVNTPTPQTDKKFAVIVAGRVLGTQARIINSDKNTVANYLEEENADAGDEYLQQSPTNTFNDLLYFQ